MPATRLQLRTRARIRADQTNSDFPTDAEYNILLEEAANETWGDLFMAGWPIEVDSVTGLFTGAVAYDLDGGDLSILSVQGVYRIEGTQEYKLKRLDRERLPSLRSNPGTGIPIYYYLSWSYTNGPQVEFYPRPTSGRYRLDLTREANAFQADSDMWMGPARSDELLVLRAAAKALRKEGSDRDAWALDQEYAKLFEKVTAMASWFDQSEPAKVRIVDNAPAGSRTAFDFDVGGYE